MSHQRVVILGSQPTTRSATSYKAMKVLQEHGHETVLVNRGVTEIEGQPVLRGRRRRDGSGEDTLTMYVKEEVS